MRCFRSDQSMSAPWSALCTSFVMPKNSSLPLITCHSASMPTLRSRGTWVASSSATPPPYAVALMCNTRQPRNGAASASMRSTTSGPTIGAYSPRPFSRSGTRSGTRCNLSTVAEAIVAPDKFRGSLTAAAAADAMAAGVEAAGFSARRIPVADGGEGTLDALLAARGGSTRTTTVTGPLGDPVAAQWGLLPDGTGVIEMARASGLQLVGLRNDPLRASTRGTGELISAALRAGARRVIVGVGGSATTDGGLGAVDALRWSLAGHDVAVARDVATTFLDAATGYGPQKGATSAQVSLLTGRLARLAEVYQERTGVDVTELEGAGAAGGLAGGLAAIGAQLEPGFDVVARAAGLDDALAGAALVVTGEGKLDPTSFEGKVVGGVLEWAADEGVAKRVVIVGQATQEGRDELSVLGDVQLLTLTERVWQSGEAFARAALLVEEAAIEAARRAREAR